MSRNLFEQLVLNSNEFQKSVKIPTKANQIAELATDNERKSAIVNQARSARIVVHQRIFQLAKDFLKVKTKFGSERERNFYPQFTRVEDFLRRLIEKRPLTFFSDDDITLLRNGTRLEKPASEDWQLVGSDKEGALKLEDYLSYDEMQISALLATSGPVYFINNGDRNNCGIADPQTASPYPFEAIHCGVAGARFELNGKMESQHILVQEKVNTHANGYGEGEQGQVARKKLLKIWGDFYNFDDHKHLKSYGFPTFDSLVKRYGGSLDAIKTDVLYDSYMLFKPPRRDPFFFNVYIYKQRMQISVESYLSEANDRARSFGKSAYCHFVGIGLGTWAKSEEKQSEWLVELVMETIKTNKYANISDINFAYFKNRPESEEKLRTNHNDINVHFSKRNPADVLTGKDRKKLLVVMYAWDGNAMPGNEYWMASAMAKANDQRACLIASGDPAAACCSTIPELLNPYINPYLLKNIYKAEGRVIPRPKSDEVMSQKLYRIRSQSYPLLLLHSTAKRKHVSRIERTRLKKRPFSIHTNNCLNALALKSADKDANVSLPELRTPKALPVGVLSKDTLGFSLGVSPALLQVLEDFNQTLRSTNDFLESFDNEVIYSIKAPRPLSSSAHRIRADPRGDFRSSNIQVPESLKLTSPRSERSTKPRQPLMIPQRQNVHVCQLCKDTSKTLPLFCKQCHCPMSCISQNSKPVKPIFAPVAIDTTPTNAFHFELEGLGFEENERTSQLQLERVSTKALYPLLFDSRTPTKFIRMFLMCFEEVLAPMALFIELRDFFFVGTDSRAERIIEIFTDWIVYNPTTIVDNTEVMDQFAEFYAYLNNRGGLYADYATQLQQAMQPFLVKADTSADQSFIYEQESFKRLVFPVLLDAKVYQQNKEKVNIVKFHPVEVARQLTIMTKALFDQVDRKEFINKRFEQGKTTAPTLTRFSEKMSFLTQWATTVLYAADSPKKRAKVIIFFVHVAEKLQELQNFAAAFNIYAFLDLLTTTRLTRSWKLVPSDISKRILALKEFMSPLGNFKNIRPLFEKNGNPPLIPIFPMLLRDIVLIEDGNDSWNADKTEINVEKLEMIGKILRRVYELQKVNYVLWPIPFLQNYFATFVPLPSEHIDKLARLAESD